MTSGKSSTYFSSSLCYADGSFRGPLSAKRQGLPSGPFEIGEDVMYSDSYTNSGGNGCLGSKFEKKVGTIRTLPPPPPGTPISPGVPYSSNAGYYQVDVTINGKKSSQSSYKVTQT